MVRIQWSLPCFHCDMIMIKYMNIHMKVSSNGGISRSYQETNDFGYPLNVKNHPYGHIQYTSIYIILSNDPFANLMFFFQVRRPLLSSLPIFRATFIHPGGTDQEFRRVSELVRGPCKTVHPCTMATDGCLAKSLFFWVFFPLQFLVILGLVILGYDTMINLVFTCMQSRLS
jgi:hypothetical protein